MGLMFRQPKGKGVPDACASQRDGVVVDARTIGMTRPTARRLMDLLAGAVLCIGPRTLTGVAIFVGRFRICYGVADIAPHPPEFDDAFGLSMKKASRHEGSRHQVGANVPTRLATPANHASRR